jgi:hypothetical protein
MTVVWGVQPSRLENPPFEGSVFLRDEIRRDY